MAKTKLRDKLLAAGLLCVICGFTVRHLYSLIWKNPQFVNLRAIDRWKNDVQSQLDAYEVHEKMDMRVYRYTDGDGVILIELWDPVDDSQTTRTLEFIETLHPPRPVWWTVYPKGRSEIRFVREYPTLSTGKNISNQSTKPTLTPQMD